MIQRMQSIWLLLAGVTTLCLLFVPIITNTIGNVTYHILASGLYEKTAPAEGGEINTFLPLLISTALVSIISFINIFNYKRRTLQKRITLTTVLLLIGLSFWCSRYAQKIPGGIETATYGIGVFLPMIAILFCALAIRGINNDEKLIRSADRLR